MVKEIDDRKNKNSNDITLRDILTNAKLFFDYLLSKWKLICSLSILGAALGLGYAYIKEPVYTATTTFVLESGESAGSLGQYAGLASMVGVNLGGTAGGIFQGENILELYKSSTMIKKTLLTEVDHNGKKQLLVDRYADFNNLREAWLKKPHLAGFKFQASIDSLNAGTLRVQDSILSTIITQIRKNNLQISKPDKALSIIQVEVKAEDEFFAKNFNDFIVRNVNDFYIQTKSKRSIENVNILQQKTDSVRAVMNGAIYTAAAISDATPNLNPTRQLQRTAPVQRSQFSAETNKAILSELLKNLELSKIALRKEIPLIQVVDQPYFPLPVIIFGKIKGVVIGAFLFGLLTTAFLSFKFVVRSLLS